MPFKRLKKEEKEILNKKYIRQFGKEEGTNYANFRANVLEHWINIKTKNVAKEDT